MNGSAPHYTDPTDPLRREDQLDEMDRLIAQRLLEKLKDAKFCTAAHIELARKYLAHRGHHGPSISGMKKTGAQHPAIDLASVDLSGVQKYIS